jgi:hypothetical protein
LGEFKVQGLDYYYTLQGWLKGVNLPKQDLLLPMDINMPKDEFAFNLGYHKDDYQPIGGDIHLPGERDEIWERYNESMSGNGLFNGNIAGWRPIFGRWAEGTAKVTRP